MLAMAGMLGCGEAEDTSEIREDAGSPFDAGYEASLLLDAAEAGALCTLSGSYVVSYQERTGDCGNLPELPATADEMFWYLPSGCVVLGETLSADECDWTRRWNCTAADGTVTASAVALSLALDASGGTGTLTVRKLGADGTTICSSEYDVTLTQE